MTEVQGDNVTFWLLLAVVTASVVGSAFILMDFIDGTPLSGVDGIRDMAAGSAVQEVVEEAEEDDVVSFNTPY